MSEISCNIIKDLLPLYIDLAVSEDTEKMVKQHLALCESCRKEADAMKKNIVIPSNQKVRLAQAALLKKWKKHLFQKKVIISVLSIVLFMSAITGAYGFMATTEEILPYSGGQISLKEIDGKLYAMCSSNTMYGSYMLNPVSVTENGEEKEIVAFYFYETLWSKHVESLFRNEKEKEPYLLLLGSKDTIDEIYYGEFDAHDELFFCQIPQNLKTMEKIWSK